MKPEEVIKRVTDMEIWNDAVWINHTEKIFFVPIWRNGNTTFMYNIAKRFQFDLEKNVDLNNYLGFTIIRHPRKRILGQIWRACVNNNYSIDDVIDNLQKNVVVDVHLNTQDSFLNMYYINYFLDLDNLTYVNNTFINKIIDVYINPNLKKHNEKDKNFLLDIQFYLENTPNAYKIIDNFYKIDYDLYKRI